MEEARKGHQEAFDEVTSKYNRLAKDKAVLDKALNEITGELRSEQRRAAVIHTSFEELQKDTASKTDKMIEKLKGISAKAEGFERELYGERMMSDSLRQRIADDAIKIGAMEGAMGEMRDQIDARDGTIAQQDEDKDGLRGEILRVKRLLDERGPRDEDVAERHRLLGELYAQIKLTKVAERDVRTHKEAARLNDNSYTHIFGQGALVAGDRLVGVAEDGTLITRSQSMPVLAGTLAPRAFLKKLPALQVDATEAADPASQFESQPDGWMVGGISGTSPRSGAGRSPRHMRLVHKRGPSSLPKLPSSRLPVTAEQQKLRVQWQQHRESTDQDIANSPSEAPSLKAVYGL